MEIVRATDNTRDFWVYSKPLAQFFVANGLEVKEIRPDVMYAGKYNWLFEKSDKLYELLDFYNADRIMYQKEHKK